MSLFRAIREGLGWELGKTLAKKSLEQASEKLEDTIFGPDDEKKDEKPETPAQRAKREAAEKKAAEAAAREEERRRKEEAKRRAAEAVAAERSIDAELAAMKKKLGKKK